jgi:hypothetical protein
LQNTRCDGRADMNGVFDKQTSGNNWTPVVGPMLHEREQDQLVPPEARRQHLIFNEYERQMARHEQDHLTMVTEVARNYVMPRDNSVQAFLNSHRVLPQLLIQALPQLRGHFGNVVFALRATSDEHGWQRLYVDAMWQGSSADAFQAIDRFQDAWWIANSHMAAGHLTFTYRLV